MTAATSTQFGRMLVASELEQAVIDLLVKWFPTYLSELERQLDIQHNSLPQPINYTNRNSFDTLAGEKIPKVVVLSEGTDSVPVKFGRGQYRATWRLGVGVATGAKDERTGNMYVKAYGAAVRGIMLQQAGDLGVPGIANVSWTSETYDDLPIPNQHMLFKAASIFFSVDVEDVINTQVGPLEPIQVGVIPGNYPEVEVVIIDKELGGSVMPETQFRWVGDHPREFAVVKDEQTTYQFLAPGDFVNLDPDSFDAETKELVDTNQLYDVEAFNAAAAKAEEEAAAQQEAAAANEEETATEEAPATKTAKGGKA